MERKSGSTISASDEIEIILVKLCFSSLVVVESIKFQSSDNAATTSFSYNFEKLAFYSCYAATGILIGNKV